MADLDLNGESERWRHRLGARPSGSEIGNLMYIEMLSKARRCSPEVGGQEEERHGVLASLASVGCWFLGYGAHVTGR
jgi:hypothetical protein